MHAEDAPKQLFDLALRAAYEAAIAGLVVIAEDGDLPEIEDVPFALIAVDGRRIWREVRSKLIKLPSPQAPYAEIVVFLEPYRLGSYADGDVMAVNPEVGACPWEIAHLKVLESLITRMDGIAAIHNSHKQPGFVRSFGSHIARLFVRPGHVWHIVTAGSGRAPIEDHAFAVCVEAMIPLVGALTRADDERPVFELLNMVTRGSFRIAEICYPKSS